MTNLSMPRCDIEELKQENKQLRQLLKECRNFLDNLYFPVIHEDYDTNITNNLMRDISNRINAAIGESEEPDETC